MASLVLLSMPTSLLISHIITNDDEETMGNGRVDDSYTRQSLMSTPNVDSDRGLQRVVLFPLDAAVLSHLLG
ncbi:hypothetical protein [Acaryochloris sp. IP29b_bin.148]|uniref:hypothetical protein n=1 Tax=Acaryochloris sp. IP29b_bin.148 TaxID=2969218 RepID=UPI00262EDC57|nr:hypothetical protein [Acaryochloris sp. IP29b_bin.148]